ncbi:hypothetical protein KUCAC02_019370 [Chaenocephalus aceratus]|uniref:Uncharacterized protein n=1 Tax=Chaenocephalus aceratus TaxID=36190 RepID=A0ACB9VPF7_CHAAC|nr:hypothetical protein KUCAC02_019370 [Chaenocephalus aceratus]
MLQCQAEVFGAPSAEDLRGASQIQHPEERAEGPNTTSCWSPQSGTKNWTCGRPSTWTPWSTWEALEVVTARLEDRLNLCKANVMMVTCFDAGTRRRHKRRRRKVPEQRALKGIKPETSVRIGKGGGNISIP